MRPRAHLPHHHGRFAWTHGREGGFSLPELAITLLVVVVLSAGLLLPMGQIDNRKVDETRLMLEQAQEALIVFAAQYGYLPCPADAASGGAEPTATAHATGYCPVYHGFLPAKLLGFTPLDPEGYAVDAWGSAPNRIRYAVADRLGAVMSPFTRTGGMAAVGPSLVAGANDLFHVCGSGNGVDPGVKCDIAQTLTTSAVIVVWSTGPNGAGGGASVHEAENPNAITGSADKIFVSRPRTAGAGTDFDDIVLWVPALTLVDRLVKAGRLP